MYRKSLDPDTARVWGIILNINCFVGVLLFVILPMRFIIDNVLNDQVFLFFIIPVCSVFLMLYVRFSILVFYHDWYDIERNFTINDFLCGMYVFDFSILLTSFLIFCICIGDFLVRFSWLSGLVVKNYLVVPLEFVFMVAFFMIPFIGEAIEGKSYLKDREKKKEVVE